MDTTKSSSLKLSWPIKGKITINQGFGENPEYYSKFGYRGHTGCDIGAAHGTPVYAACDGIAFYVTDKYGGDGIYVNSKDDQGNYYNTIYWHLIGHDGSSLAPVIPKTGFYPVKEGALLGHSDNSGAPYESTGDHLHFGLMPCNANYTPIDQRNGYGGTIDPAPFLPPVPNATQIQAVEQSIQQATQILQTVAQSPEPPRVKAELFDLLKKVVIQIENSLIKLL